MLRCIVVGKFEKDGEKKTYTWKFPAIGPDHAARLASNCMGVYVDLGWNILEVNLSIGANYEEK